MQETPGHASAAAMDLPPLNAADLESLRDKRIFFGHRSVGANIVEWGIPAVYDEFGVDPPRLGDAATESGGQFIDSWLVQTDDPMDKVKDFDRWMRSAGAEASLDIAFMKLGYVDITETTDVPALFSSYLEVMDRLEADFPSVTFIHSTITVTDWRLDLDAIIEEFNTLMRAEYRMPGELIDLAWAVSNCTDGTVRAGVTEAGDPYLAICPEYTDDGGHLNAVGAKAAATVLLRTLAGAET